MKLHFENLQEEVFIMDLHEEISELDTTIEHCSSKPKTFPPEMYTQKTLTKKNKKTKKPQKLQSSRHNQPNIKETRIRRQ